jgi:secondary thiamine-phosphate synthase enzyme
MKIYNKTIQVESTSQIEFINVTDKVSEIVAQSGIRDGQVLVYAPHTTASILVNHNEPLLIQDFIKVLHRVVPVTNNYSHDLFEISRGGTSDGRSNGHSHCKSMLIGGVSETLPIEKGKMFLTERQCIFLAEMDGARKREIFVQVVGV